MSLLAQSNETLAVLGGPRTIVGETPELFHWPITTVEDEQAVLQVIRDSAMSGLDITRAFEEEYAQFIGTEFAPASCSSTASIAEAMFTVGLGRGDEIIGPSITYWASLLQSFAFGATPIFADINPRALCIDAKDIEHRITPRTRAFMVVHYCGHPCDMDSIMAISDDTT